MFDLDTIKFMNSPRGSARIRSLARATNKMEVDPCASHPRYKGQRKPRGNCVDCWRIYVRVNP